MSKKEKHSDPSQRQTIDNPEVQSANPMEADNGENRKKYIVLSGRVVLVLAIFLGEGTYRLINDGVTFWSAAGLLLIVVLFFYWLDQRIKVRNDKTYKNTTWTRVGQLLGYQVCFYYLLCYKGLYGGYQLIQDFSWPALGWVVLAALLALVFEKNTRNMMNALYNMSHFSKSEMVHSYLLKEVKT
ncbi:MAG: hypothetical protein AAF502_23375 [Bacteroidota bacterium]